MSNNRIQPDPGPDPIPVSGDNDDAYYRGLDIDCDENNAVRESQAMEKATANGDMYAAIKDVRTVCSYCSFKRRGIKNERQSED